MHQSNDNIFDKIDPRLSFTTEKNETYYQSNSVVKN